MKADHSFTQQRFYFKTSYFLGLNMWFWVAFRWRIFSPLECFKNCITSITFNNTLKLTSFNFSTQWLKSQGYFDLYRLFTVSGMFMSLEDHCSSVGQDDNDPGAGAQTLIFGLYLGRPFGSPLEGEPHIWEWADTRAYMRMNVIGWA